MRTLYMVPRMYTVEELLLILPEIPKDYSNISAEFWEYIEGKLIPFKNNIKHLYRDVVTVGGSIGLRFVKEIDEECHKIMEKLVSFGSSLEATEEPGLLAEAESWVKLMRAGRIKGAVMELFRDNLIERDNYVAKVITDTLKSNECGVLFIEPSRRIQVPSDFKVIRVCPFEPSDYVNRVVAERKD